MLPLNRKKFIDKATVENCILYYENNDIFLETNKEYLLSKKELLSHTCFTAPQLQEFIHKTRQSNYTDFTYGDYPHKKNEIKKSISLSYRSLIDCMYIQIPYFTNKLVTEVKNLLFDSNSPDLIIDLRDSPGGYTEACMDFCRLFLDETDIALFRYKNKRVIHFKSGPCAFRFNRIFIFINSNTASCSEIATLALRLNLSMVTLVGSSTFGKGFGQDFIRNEKFGFSLTIPTFTWECKNAGIETLHTLIEQDNKQHLLFKKNEDYFACVLNQL
ncbi:hypothetical protein CDO73_12455 [Saccharibacillus sp. O23]|uniref:S41 family peptidase n=1 Tax=Saccharibacillus sp. O23 TaxID=2009338 RepID=UPI000B4E82E4|nr:S41 family peptidase [Saccharibacillus sp. O23]OWR29889.1 hypothetical protein CDO73_12455 [Saccharibacillus sp. O23]